MARRIIAGMPLALMVLTSGCVTLDTSLLHTAQPEDERPCWITGYWDRNVRIALNTKSKGFRPEEMPVLAGRVYFFGADPKTPLTPRGTLVVDFYDVSGPSDGEPPLLGRTVYGNADLQKMRSVNLLGMGYTILADWQTYDPKYTRVKVQVTFLPEKGGEPVFADPAVVSLQRTRVERSSGMRLPGLESAPQGAPQIPFTPPPPMPLGR